MRWAPPLEQSTNVTDSSPHWSKWTVREPCVTVFSMQTGGYAAAPGTKARAPRPSRQTNAMATERIGPRQLGLDYKVCCVYPIYRTAAMEMLPGTMPRIPRRGVEQERRRVRTVTPKRETPARK